MLQATRLRKQVKETYILQDISLSVEAGEILCIIGPSGAGKTSVLKALSLLDLPDSGSISIDSKTYEFPWIGKEKPEYPYPKLTVVFQQLFLWPHLTVRENLTLPLKGMTDEQHFTEIIKLFRMTDFLDRYPNEISVGQKQRSALARALLLKPNYLLLDEVTAALDVEQSHLILSHLKQISSTGVGIIFVTHALHLASKISNKVVFLDGGRVIEIGTGDILENPKTERLRAFVNAAKQIV